jgi:hypothetical protein
MQSVNPFRQHIPGEDPAPGTLGTGQDTCPHCEGTGKQVDETGEPTGDACLRCDGIGKVIQWIDYRPAVWSARLQEFDSRFALALSCFEAGVTRPIAGRAGKA